MGDSAPRAIVVSEVRAFGDRNGSLRSVLKKYAPHDRFDLLTVASPDALLLPDAGRLLDRLAEGIAARLASCGPAVILVALYGDARPLAGALDAHPILQTEAVTCFVACDLREQFDPDRADPLRRQYGWPKIGKSLAIVDCDERLHAPHRGRELADGLQRDLGLHDAPAILAVPGGAEALYETGPACDFALAQLAILWKRPGFLQIALTAGMEGGVARHERQRLEERLNVASGTVRTHFSSAHIVPAVLRLGPDRLDRISRVRL